MGDAVQCVGRLNPEHTELEPSRCAGFEQDGKFERIELETAKMACLDGDVRFP